ncbi:putative polyketide synthase [Xylaria castorea]|nr:putative polyketide synthase [Xylaria castorea]
MTATKLLFFGPKSSSCDWAYLNHVRLRVLDDSRNQWILQQVRELGTLLQSIQEQITILNLAECQTWLQFLLRWFQTGDAEGVQVSELPNVVTVSLVVIGQLTEYTWYSGQVRDDDDELGQNVLELESDTETAGFCIGMLSAIAIACSSTWAQLHLNGSAAIRLAMVIGAIVDVQEAEGKKSVSLSVLWKSTNELSALEQILETTPDAYSSVCFDKNRTTITVSQNGLETLKTRLQTARVTYNVVQIHGRYHTPRHQSSLEALVRLCQTHSNMQLPQWTALVVPTYLNNGQRIERGSLHEVAIQAILVDRCDWYKTCQAVMSKLAPGLSSSIITFGCEVCIPPSVLRATSARIIQASQLFRVMPVTPTPTKDDIAIIGMSCNVPGAQDLDGFWSLLMAGKSQHRELDSSRFMFNTPFRLNSNPCKKWYGNFIDDYDAFDHKFFFKSKREASSMDPQQRLLYEAAYQAVSQSGYFQTTVKKRERNVGCYIGVCYNDYEHNVSHHQPNAFSATGNLRAFVAGKVSHYFGWYGPSLTVDTACSSSNVAIHLACQAILSGECETALAGGTNFISSPVLFQNLAAASFLSPTGQSKPFDFDADGYCRGEAVAVVLLKKMTRALQDHDHIVGTIASTAVFQNENCTPIFVPNDPSLSHLFHTALEKAGIGPEQVSVVEAHGTGTPVGDPAEYASIRKVFGSRSRLKPLQLGSVKGLVGHTEASSGSVSLIKLLLMLHESYIPPQPSFRALNPSIHVSAHDGIDISTRPIFWQRESKIALINNYGASGSNASIVVKQAFSTVSQRNSPVDFQLPFYISAHDQEALKSYTLRLERFVKQGHTSRRHLTLRNLAFNLYRQSNPDLKFALIFSSSSVDELVEKLAAFHQGHGSEGIHSVNPPEPRPVILCFGGQTSSWIGLDLRVYEENLILRSYLDKCDAISQELGAEGIYPFIFSREPIGICPLQLSLFSLQYSCAMSWISCGIEPVALVGHSFGELTALCVSGILSLEDTLKLVIERSRIVETRWDIERGSMMAVEGDLESIRALLDLEPAAVSIACFNGPRSCTLGGSTDAINNIARYIASGKHEIAVRHKILGVSHAFHTSLADPLKPDLERLGRDMNFMKPKIHLECARQSPCRGSVSSTYVYDHIRQPVHWYAAVKRLSKKHPSAIWLEAGSNSITSMAIKALESPKNCLFQPVNITNNQSPSQLVEATMNLWRAGIRTAYWAHARSSTDQYALILLPPYQFHKYRHWLEYRVAPTEPLKTKQLVGPMGLYEFQEYLDPQRTRARFRINTSASKYREAMSSHSISKTAPICPGTLQLSIAVEAIVSIHAPDIKASVLLQISNVKYQSPLCDEPSRTVFMEVEQLKGQAFIWVFKIFSCQEAGAREIHHVTGEVQMKRLDENWADLKAPGVDPPLCYKRCVELLDGSAADYIIQGPSVYKAFSSIVDYGEMYRGVQRIVGKDNWSAGLVVKNIAHGSLFDPLLGDCFCQVAGIWVNCMWNGSFEDMYLASGINEWMLSPEFLRDWPVDSEQEWHVLAHHTQDSSGNAFSTDILVFEPGSGQVLQAIRGITFTKVPRTSMIKILTRHMNPSLIAEQIEVPPPSRESTSMNTQSFNTHTLPNRQGASDILCRLKRAVGEITGLQPDEIADNTNLADIGIDSLTGMELANDLEGTFGCILSHNDLVMISDLSSLLRLVQRALGADSNGDPGLKPNGTMADYHQPDSWSTSVNNIAESSPADGSSSAEPMVLIPATTNMDTTMTMECFAESKLHTDRFIREYGFEGYAQEVLPSYTVFSIILVIEAFKTLGCDLSLAQPGQALERIRYTPEQHHFQNRVYKILEEHGIIDLDGDQIVRTDASLASMTSASYVEHLNREHVDHKCVTDMVYRAGSKLADILIGKLDGVELLFGTEDDRQLLATFYGEYGLNKLYIEQMAQFINSLITRISIDGDLEILRIMEMGAGSGEIPVEYTFTDLSPSSIARAKKKFKQYPFVKFAVHDIEHPPSEHDMFASQHIVIASNAVHATRSLAVSSRNIRKFLRPGSFLLMLEMTQTLPWVDIVFGPLKGWWLFDDGRTHALVDETRWARELRKAGYGYVDWTDGVFPEAKVQKLIIAIASDLGHPKPLSSPPPADHQTRTQGARKIETDTYIQSGIQSFSIPAALRPCTSRQSNCSTSVLVTGATGSLGCHLVAHLANLPHVGTVYCINRRSNKDPITRQMDSLRLKGIALDFSAAKKLKVHETDSSQPRLGLLPDRYQEILESANHIVHNAWPMSLKSPMKSFEPQFATMRNLLDLAAAISANRAEGTKVSFQLISSIATVGHYPLHHGMHLVPEVPMTIESVLPTGYAEAKFVCERMLRETIALQPGRFRAMTVRLGQVAGSSSGYWNNMEHIAFILKSSQRLGVLPDLSGSLSWTPVNDVAGTLVDLLLPDETASCCPVYHVENPVRQPWSEVISVLANSFGIPPSGIIPFQDWLDRVRGFDGSEMENPAARIVDFLANDFERMSCGGLVLSLSNTLKYSQTLRQVVPIDEDTLRRYIRAWKLRRFLA